MIMLISFNQMITIEIPALPISVNKAFRQAGRFRVRTREYDEWNYLVERHIPDGIPDWNAPFTRLSVEIDLVSNKWMTSKGVRKKDLDNFVKTTLDAIFKHLTVDDSAIFHLNVQKLGSYGNDLEKTVVRIAHMDVQ